MQDNKHPELGKYIEQYGGRIGATPFKIFILRIGKHTEDEALISIVNVDHPVDGKIYRYKKWWNTRDHRDNNYLYKNQDLNKDHINRFALWTIPRKDPQEFEFSLRGFSRETVATPLEHQANLDPRDMYGRYIRQKAGEPGPEETEDSVSKVKENETGVLLSDFTPRQLAVLKKIALGYSCKEVAQSLFITANTVNSHKKNLFSKIGVKNNAGLVIFAIKNGILDKEINDF